MGKGTSWKDLTADQTRRRQAWVRGGRGLLREDPTIPPADPETRRITEEIRQRVRAQRVAEGRL